MRSRGGMRRDEELQGLKVWKVGRSLLKLCRWRFNLGRELHSGDVSSNILGGTGSAHKSATTVIVACSLFVAALSLFTEPGAKEIQVCQAIADLVGGA